jgi:copper oxidase (laccase) domain-containing protein
MLLPNQDGAVKFDLWAANRLVLEKAGIRCVEVAGICTACDPLDWYSHRGERGKTGRFGVVIGLEE